MQRENLDSDIDAVLPVKPSEADRRPLNEGIMARAFSAPATSAVIDTSREPASGSFPWKLVAAGALVLAIGVALARTVGQRSTGAEESRSVASGIETSPPAGADTATVGATLASAAPTAPVSAPSAAPAVTAAAPTTPAPPAPSTTRNPAPTPAAPTASAPTRAVAAPSLAPASTPAVPSADAGRPSTVSQPVDAPRPAALPRQEPVVAAPTPSAATPTTAPAAVPSVAPSAAEVAAAAAAQRARDLELQAIREEIARRSARLDSMGRAINTIYAPPKPGSTPGSPPPSDR